MRPTHCLALLALHALLALLALLAATAACRPTLDRGVPQSASAPPTPGTRSSAAPLATKRVAAKRAPDTLLAEDATRCAVRAEAFERVEVGSPVRCGWSRDGARER